MNLKQKIALALLIPLSTLAATRTKGKTSTEYSIEGWGVSLCWWAHMCGQWPEERLDSLVDWLVSPEGLNYNVFRYNIGGGDDPNWTNCTPHHMGARGGKGLRAEMPGFTKGALTAAEACSEKRFANYDWNADEGQRRILLMIKRKRPDAIIEAFSNSAPWWMTVSGCVGGAAEATDDNVAPEMYEAFAHYLVDVCKHYYDTYGIEFHSLDPFNEPETNYWPQNGSQEGCHFWPATQIAMIRVLAPILKESGLKTIISASDETSVGQSIIDLQAYDKAGVLPLVGQWNTHTYQGNAQNKKRLCHLADSLHIRLWQSETGDGGRGLNGNLHMSLRLIEDMKCLKAPVWCDWQYVEENYDQWSLVKCDSKWGTFQRHKNYYVRQHFSRFMPAGYRILDAGSQQELIARSPDSRELVAVAVNPHRSTVRHSIVLPNGFDSATIQVYLTDHTHNCSRTDSLTCKRSGQVITFPLEANSIVTLVLRK